MKLIKELPGVSADLLDNIVSRLVRWDFFDKDLFEKSGILTSKGIQRRYFEIIKRRSKNEDDFPYLLVNVCNKRVSAYKNTLSTAVNVYNNSQSKVNKIKDPPFIPPKGEGEEDEKFDFNSLKPPEDGINRNFQALMEFLQKYPFSEIEKKKVILASNYGQIGHRIWELAAEVRNNTGIKLPAKFVISRLGL